LIDRQEVLPVATCEVDATDETNGTSATFGDPELEKLAQRYSEASARGDREKGDMAAESVLAWFSAQSRAFDVPAHHVEGLTAPRREATYVMTYDVADLVKPMRLSTIQLPGEPTREPLHPSVTGTDEFDFGSLIDLIVTTIEHDSWMENGTGEGEILPIPANVSLVISQTQRVHEQITDLFAQLRRLQAPRVELRVFSITASQESLAAIRLDAKRQQVLTAAQRDRLIEAIERCPASSVTKMGAPAAFNGQQVAVKGNGRRPTLTLQPIIGSAESDPVAIYVVSRNGLKAWAQRNIVRVGETLLIGPSASESRVQDSATVCHWLLVEPHLLSRAP
jgi:hypothetical protein